MYGAFLNRNSNGLKNIELYNLRVVNHSLFSPVKMFRVPLIHVEESLLIGDLDDILTGALPDDKLASDILFIVDESLDPLGHF